MSDDARLQEIRAKDERYDPSSSPSVVGDDRRFLLRQLDEQREQIAANFDHLAGQRNPNDPLASAIASRMYEEAAYRIRHPEQFSGVAKAAVDA